MIARSLVAAACIAWQSLAAGATVFNADAAGVALGGHDVVAYFTERRARPGDPAHAAAWGGAVWHFANAANRQRFVADPDAYAPRFGGWCALAMASGRVVEVDFEDAWTVDGGKLYFNFDRSVRLRWLRGINRYLRKARARWPDARAALESGAATVHRRRSMPLH